MAAVAASGAYKSEAHQSLVETFQGVAPVMVVLANLFPVNELDRFEYPQTVQVVENGVERSVASGFTMRFTFTGLCDKKMRRKPDFQAGGFKGTLRVAAVVVGYIDGNRIAFVQGLWATKFGAELKVSDFVATNAEYTPELAAQATNEDENAVATLQVSKRMFGKERVKAIPLTLHRIHNTHANYGIKA